MLAFALDHINRRAEQRVRERVAELAGGADLGEVPPRAVLRACLAAMLPLDERSRTGALIGAACFTRAVHDAGLRARAAEGIPALRDLFAGLLRGAAERGELRPRRAPEAEAMLLISLVDGLSAYVLLDVHGPEQALALLDGHLADLFADPAEG